MKIDLKMIVTNSRRRSKDEQRSHLERKYLASLLPDQINFALLLYKRFAHQRILCQGQRAFQRSLPPLNCSSPLSVRVHADPMQQSKRFHTFAVCSAPSLPPSTVLSLPLL